MKRQLFLMSFGIGAMILAASDALANVACGPHDVITSRLAELYGEQRQAIGLAGNNAVMELFSSQETGTWTITLTRADGTTCMMASGQHFDLDQVALVLDGNDA